MKENFDDTVKEWFPSKNVNLLLKLEDDEGVDDFDNAKSVNTMPSHFGSNILSHSKRLMNDVIRQKVVSIVIVITTQIPILCVYAKNTGLNCLIMDLLANILLV